FSEKEPIKSRREDVSGKIPLKNFCPFFRLTEISLNCQKRTKNSRFQKNGLNRREQSERWEKMIH
ncbi:MAG: hypothetical protein QMD20_00670, partial [Candidatus Bathyarchaeia archaeon]|nr:hypothetical protein [Candidatus Bathyarchaeia archaeon]